MLARTPFSLSRSECVGMSGCLEQILSEINLLRLPFPLSLLPPEEDSTERTRVKEREEERKGGRAVRTKIFAVSSGFCNIRGSSEGRSWETIDETPAGSSTRVHQP